MANLLAAWIQIDLVRGWRYLDDAGKVMNLYDERFPKKQVGVQGLTMQNDVHSGLREMQLSAERLWLHYLRPSTLTQVADQARTVVDEVASTIAVSAAKRMGLRANYTIDIQSPERGNDLVRKLFLNPTAPLLFGNPDLFTPDLRFRQSDGTWFTLRIGTGSPGKTVENDVAPHVLVVDTDTYVHRDGADLPIDGTRRFFRRAEELNRSVVSDLLPMLEGARDHG